MCPPPRRWGRKARTPWTTPHRLTPSTHSQRASARTTGRRRPPTPALLHTTCTRAEAVDRRLRERLDGLLLADVGLHRRASRRRARRSARRPSASASSCTSASTTFMPALAKRLRQRVPDPTRRAGDDCDLSPLSSMPGNVVRPVARPTRSGHSAEVPGLRRMTLRPEGVTWQWRPGIPPLHGLGTTGAARARSRQLAVIWTGRIDGRPPRTRSVVGEGARTALDALVDAEGAHVPPSTEPSSSKTYLQRRQRAEAAGRRRSSRCSSRRRSRRRRSRRRTTAASDPPGVAGRGHPSRRCSSRTVTVSPACFAIAARSAA